LNFITVKHSLRLCDIKNNYTIHELRQLTYSSSYRISSKQGAIHQNV